MALARAHPFDPDAPAAVRRPLAQPRQATGCLRRPWSRCARLLHASRSHIVETRFQEVFPKWEWVFPEQASKFPKRSIFRT